MPNLVDSRTVNYLNEELKKTNKTIELYNMLVLNVGLLVLFILGLGIILYMRYKRKNEGDIEYEEKKRNSILKKIGDLTAISKQSNPEMITNLPKFEGIL